MKNRIIFYSILGLLLFLALYFKNNADMVCSKLGDFYYHRDIKKSQEFYEKSFLLGNRNSKERDIYVTSLINSPLTLDTEEKLASIAEDEIQDGASLKAKFFLSDLKREIHRNYNHNYIKQAPFNQKIMRWGKLPITYMYVNTNGVPEEFVTEIDNAFAEWERASALQVKFAKVSKNANIVVDFQQNKVESLEYGKKYVVAYTVPLVNANKLKNMSIKFYLQDLEGNYFSKNQIYNTALHEIFHALGFMGHSYDKNNIMYLAKDNNTLVNDVRRQPTEADTTTLSLLYKIKPDITNSDEIKGEYIPYLILGDEEEVNYSKAREAKNYIRQAPTLPNGYIDLAESLVAEKKYPAAIRNLEKALSLADNDELRYIVFYNLAISYYYIDHQEMVQSYLNQACEINDTNEIHYMLAESYLKQGKSDLAINEYKYLIKSEPKNVDYAINLANIYLKKHDYLNARKILKKYLKYNPQEKNNSRFERYKLLLLF